jgi:hypothetical protein
MGAERFDQYQAGKQSQEAFGKAREEAFYEYGHRGYTGSLAEKYEFILRNDGKPLTKKEAEAFADFDLDQNDHDKWGPAWAIAIRSDDSSEIVGFLFYGYASS